MSMKRAALLTGLWSMAESWGFRIVSAVVFLLLARLIDPAAIGLAALAQVYLVVVQTLCDQGITTALIQRESLEEGHKDSAFWANLAVGVILMALTILFAGPLANLYGEPRLAPVLRWYSLAPLLASMSVVQTALARRELRNRALALRQTAGSLVGGLVGVGMAFAGMGVFALVGQGLATQAVAAVVLWNIADWRPRFAFSRRHFMDLFGFSFNVLATDIMCIIGGHADRLLLGYFLGAAEVGYYSVAQRLISIAADFVGNSTYGTVLPLFSRIKNDKARVARGLQTAQNTLTMIVIPAFVGLAIVTPSLLWVGIGERWDPSILPAQIFAFGVYRLLARILLRPCDHGTGPTRGQAWCRLRPVFDPGGLDSRRYALRHSRRGAGSRCDAGHLLWGGADGLAPHGTILRARLPRRSPEARPRRRGDGGSRRFPRALLWG